MPTETIGFLCGLGALVVNPIPDGIFDYDYEHEHEHEHERRYQAVGPPP